MHKLRSHCNNAKANALRYMTRTVPVLLHSMCEVWNVLILCVQNSLRMLHAASMCRVDTLVWNLALILTAVTLLYEILSVIGG